MVGKQGKACLVTLVARKSRYLLGGKATSKTAAAVNKVMCEGLSGQPHLSVTPDRGKEFSKHAQLRKELKRVTFLLKGKSFTEKSLTHTQLSKALYLIL